MLDTTNIFKLALASPATRELIVGLIRAQKVLPSPPTQWAALGGRTWSAH